MPLFHLQARKNTPPASPSALFPDDFVVVGKCPVWANSTSASAGNTGNYGSLCECSDRLVPPDTCLPAYARNTCFGHCLGIERATCLVTLCHCLLLFMQSQHLLGPSHSWTPAMASSPATSPHVRTKAAHKHVPDLWHDSASAGFVRFCWLCSCVCSGCHQCMQRRSTVYAMKTNRTSLFVACLCRPGGELHERHNRSPGLPGADHQLR
jgi:hypothetical protein